MSRDKEKHAIAKHNHYVANKEKYISASTKAKRKRIEWLREYKTTHPCVECGEARVPCLEFHHPELRDEMGPESKKDRNTISYLATHRGLKVLQEEIKKCVVLCANCHKLEHWDKENNNYSRIQNASMM
jgi:hypothetical protein